MPKPANRLSDVERDRLKRFAVAIQNAAPGDPDSWPAFMLGVSREIGEPKGEPISKRYANALLSDAVIAIWKANRDFLLKWRRRYQDAHDFSERDGFTEGVEYSKKLLSEVADELKRIGGMDAAETAEFEKANGIDQERMITAASAIIDPMVDAARSAIEFALRIAGQTDTLKSGIGDAQQKTQETQEAPCPDPGGQQEPEGHDDHQAAVRA